MAELQFYNLANSLGAGVDIRHAQQKSYLAQLQAEMESEKFQRSTTAYTAQQKLLDSITDPKQRLAAIMAPDKYASSIFRDPKDYYAATESGVWDYSSGKPVFTPSPNYGLGSAPLSGGAGSNLANALPQATPQASAQATPQASAVPVVPGQANGPPVPLTSAYAQSLGRRENTTGNPAQPNLAGASSAVGNHQFLSGTWLDMIRTHRPDLAQGKSDTEILKLRENADLSAAMADSYAADNTPLLQRAGFQPTPVNLAIMHGFGPSGGMRILQAERQNPNTPLESVLSAEALAANPELRGMTIAQGRAQLEQQMTGAAGGGGAPAPAAMPEAPQGPQYPPGAVAFRTDKKSGQYVSGGKPGWGVLIDQAGNQVGTAPLPGQALEGGDLFPGIPAPYASKSPDAEAENIVAQYETLKRRNIAPNMQQEYAYKLAVRRLTEDRTVQTPEGGFATIHPSPLPTSEKVQLPGGQTVTQIVEPKPKPSAAEVKSLKDAEVQVAQVNAAIKDFRDALTETGGPSISSVMGLPTKDATRLNTAYNNLALMLKGDVLYQLGVLTGPDLGLVRRALLDPSTIAGLAARPGAVEGQLKQIEKLVAAGIESKRQQFTTDRAVPPPPPPPDPKAEETLPPEIDAEAARAELRRRGIIQ